VGSGDLTAVADAGPLIHLAEIDHLSLLEIFAELHIPERESLLLCTKLSVPVLLTDDLAVRRAAKALGLTPVGSLGVVARAHWLGRISVNTAERLLRQLATVSSLYVTPVIVELAIERLRAEGS
jgi:predicted nucleic acid-binding protein